MSSPHLPLRLGHLVPERRPVVIQRTNPLWLNLADDDPQKALTPELVDVVLQAYVFGPRCPGVIKAELASVHETYVTAGAEFRLAAGLAQAAGELIRAAGLAVAWHTFLRETIQILVPGLTSGEADVLAAVPVGDDGPGTDLLRRLNLWTTPVPEEESAPEVEGEASHPTMALSSPISPPSTDSDPANS